MFWGELQQDDASKNVTERHPLLAHCDAFGPLRFVDGRLGPRRDMEDIADA